MDIQCIFGYKINWFQILPIWSSLHSFCVLFFRALFPCGDSMVCIIDDREDVWNFSPNLIHVKPYRFFQGTADINAPPGLDKKEHDKEPITHKAHLVARSNSKEDDSDENDGKAEEAEKQHTDATQNENTEDIQSSKNKHDDDKTEELNGKKENKEKSEIVENEIKDSESKTKSESIQDTSNESKQSAKSNSEEKEEENDDVRGDEKKDLQENKPADEENGRGTTKEQEKGEKEETKNEEMEIEWDDDDDYLLYLEDILVTVHKAFYDMYDQLKSKGEDAEKPDMKNILPYVKRKVLKGKNLLFSGVFPMNVPLEKSRAYHVAKMLGANVQTDFVPKAKDGLNKSDYTTHVVAARLGTIKVKLAQKHKHVKLVNPQWLWTCAERLQHVDERLYPLNESTTGNAYCESPDAARLNRKRKNEEESDNGKRARKDEGNKMSGLEEKDVSVKKSEPESVEVAKITSSRFSTTYNPMLAFSDEDLECMDKEVEDLMDEDGNESEEDDIDRNERIRLSVLSSGDDKSSSEDSMTGDLPRGWNLKKRLRSSKSAESSSDNDEQENRPDEESENELEKYEKNMAAFAPDSESETQDSFAESIGSVDDEMAEAVEREFLAN